jgi:aldehyde:ferredoxin oxidoreductase
MTEWRYAGRILYVDLTAGAVRLEPTPLALMRRLVGGAGFVAGLLAAGTDLGPRPGEDPGVALACGPLSDGLAGRLALGARPGAPGGRMALSSLGGRMAAGLKESGYDAIVLSGRLASPGYLVVNEDGAWLEPAGPLWGLEIPVAQQWLDRLVGQGYASIVLGPAAENGVPFATLAHEGHYAGGTGVAAALGAMGLKAIAVREPREIPSRCTGCSLACPNQLDAGMASRAGALGLDAPTAARLAALAEGCARAGLLPEAADTLTELAHRTGVGSILAQGEAAALEQLGPTALQIAAGLPPVKRRGGPGMADLLGTCQRVWRDRPGQVLREALTTTLGLLTT